MAELMFDLHTMDEAEAASFGAPIALLWRASRDAEVPPTLVFRAADFPEREEGGRLAWDAELKLSKAFDAAGGEGAAVTTWDEGATRGTAEFIADKRTLLQRLPAILREASTDAVLTVGFHPAPSARGRARVERSAVEPEEGSDLLEARLWEGAIDAWRDLAASLESDLLLAWARVEDRVFLTRVERREPAPEPLSLPAKGIPWKDVQARLRTAQEADLKFADGRILGSMCTAPLPEAVRAASLFPEANLGNPGLSPGTAALEEEVIRILAALLHGPRAFGQMISGSTEGNITALWVARNATGKNEVLLPESAHFSLHKACDMLRMTPVVVALDEGYRMDVDDLRAKLTEDTAAVVAIAGTTELGLVDPVPEIGAALGEDVFLHVDAAFGGFVLPFLEDLGRDVPPFDFRVPAVSTLTLDGHKMGLAPIPSSALLVRDPDLMGEIVHRSPYLTKLEHSAILGTRASSGVAGTYAALMTLGREGLADNVAKSMDVTEFLAAGIRDLGLELPVDPVMNIVAVLVDDPEAVREAMAARGWVLSISRHPPALRLVVMPHVTRAHAEALLADLEAVGRDLGAL